jgi:hypothetical protein
MPAFINLPQIDILPNSASVPNQSSPTAIISNSASKYTATMTSGKNYFKHVKRSLVMKSQRNQGEDT